MQDGQFSLPPITIGQPSLSKPSQSTPEYKPIDFTTGFRPAGLPLDNGGLSTNPELYENVKIANQSGWTNWWNTLKNSWNDTQIGVGASDLMDGLVKKANTQRNLNQLEADFTTGKIDQMDYLTKKSSLYDDLSNAYNSIDKARTSMYGDEQDKGTIAKRYELNSQLSNLKGADDTLIDQIKYQIPTAVGSSFSLMGQSLMAGFGQKLISRVVSGALAGSEVPGIGNALGAIAGAASTLAMNLFTRNLESKAEVGSQFLQDYDQLKSEFLKSKPQDYQLSEEDDNQLVLQASKGSQTQYDKNMTLALSDTLESLIMAGGFSSMLGKFRDINKLTRALSAVGGFYAVRKLEGLEEGLQYAWQTQKSLESLGLKNTQPFFSSLLQDYKDVIGSMNFMGIQGKGLYSDDEQFKSNVHSGELLGGLFASAHTGLSIIKDINGYRDANKDLAALNPTKVEDAPLKFKDEVYAEFFKEKKKGFFGIFSQEANDRVFYFKEAIKNLGKQKNEQGERFLSKDEVNTELQNVDKAYSIFSEISDNIDNIVAPHGKDNSQLSKAQKEAFRTELFHNTMSLIRLNDDIKKYDAQSNIALNDLNDVSQVAGRLSVVNERINNSNGNYKEFLVKEKTKLEDELQTLKDTYKELDGKAPEVSPIDQSAYTALNRYYDAYETSYDYKKKKDVLAKVKTWSSLKSWAAGYQKTAPETYLKQQEDSLIQDNEEYAKALGSRPAFSTLAKEETAPRNKQNNDILERAGFTKSYLDTLSDEDKDKESEKALEDFKRKIANISDDTILGLIYSAEDKTEIQNYLSRPSIRAAFNRLGFNINDSFDSLVDKAEKRLQELQEERRKNKKRTPRPQGLTNNRGKSFITSKTKDVNDTRSISDYQDEFRIANDGTSNQKDVLNAIIGSKYASDSEKELARKILTLTGDEKISFKENWRPINQRQANVLNADNANNSDMVRRPGTTIIYPDGTYQITIDLGHFGDEIEGNQFENLAPSFEATVLHELIHAYTAKAVQEDPDINNALEQIINKAKESANNKYYGLSRPEEFVAEAMTSPEFQKFLSGIEGLGNRTLWQQFIDLVARALKSAFGVEIKGTLLEDAIALTTGIIDKKSQTSKVNVVNILSSTQANIETEFNNINPEDKKASDKLFDTYNKQLDYINNIVNDNKLGESVRNQLIDYLTNKSKEVSDKIDKAKENSKTVEFQGKIFKKGEYVVISGYSDPYSVVNANDNGLRVQSEDGKTIMSITRASNIQFQGEKAEAQEFIKNQNKPEEGYSEPAALYKSVQQEFEKKDGQWIENSDPIVKRFQDFVNRLVGTNLAKSDYRGLLVQDDDQVAGFAIPRSDATKEILAKGRKPGQVVVITDRQGNPVKINGDYVVFNIELPKSILDRSTKKLAELRGLTYEEADRLKQTVATKIREARESAANGKPVFVDFTGAVLGVQAIDAIKEVGVKPITEVDSQRVIDLVKFITKLLPEQKETKQKIKDFLFDYVIGKIEGSKISGGEIFIKGEKILNPTTQEIQDNFEYKKSFNRIKSNQPYDVLQVPKTGGINYTDIERTFPSYNDYLQTISELGSSITKDRYNGYLTYEIGEVKQTVEKAPEINQIKPESDLFEGDLFDSSIDDDSLRTNTPVVNEQEAQKLLNYLSKKYSIASTISNLGLFAEKGKFDKNIRTIIINRDSTLDKNGVPSAVFESTGNIRRRTIFHEFLHPFIQILEDANKDLYEEIYKEAKEFNNDNKFTEIDHYPVSQQKEELVVRYLDRLSDKDKSPNVLQRFIDWLSSFFYSKKTNDKATLENLYKNTSVDALYDIFKNYGNINEELDKVFKKDTIRMELKFAEQRLEMFKNDKSFTSADIKRAQDRVDLLKSLLINKDISNIDLIGQLEAEKSNFKGIFGEQYKDKKLEGDNLTSLISLSLENKEISEEAFGKKATELLYNLATFKQVTLAYHRLIRSNQEQEKSEAKKIFVKDVTYLQDLLDSKSHALDSSLDNPFNNELGLFDNKTTLDLVKSLDKGIHNYIRKTALTSIIGAMEDTDFIGKTLEETKKNIISQLNKLLALRKDQLNQGKFNQAYYDNLVKDINNKIDKLNNNFPQIIDYYRKNSYVFSFSRNISHNFDEHGNLIQEGDDRSIATLHGFDTIGNEISPIDGASKEVKALIRGLSKFKKIGDKWTKPANSWHVPDLTNFAVTWNNLLKNLQGVSTFEEMIFRLDSLQNRFPEYNELLELLRPYYAKAQQGDLESLLMISKFHKDFINPEVPVIQNLMNITNDGTIFKVDEATRKNVKDLRKQALDNFRYKSPYASKTSQGDKALNPSILNLPTASKAERVKFLEGLGFEISKETAEDPLFDVVASQQIIRYIKDEIKSIQEVKLIKSPIEDLSRQTTYNLGQTRRINDILALESKYSQSSPTLSMQNAEDNTEYAISRPNAYTVAIKAINDINKYPTFQDLVSEPQFNYLDKPNARTSHILNSIFTLDSKVNYGKRREINKKPITLQLTNISGLTIEEGDGKKTTSLFIGDKLVQDINQLLRGGFKELTRAGDKNSSFGLKVSAFIQSNGKTGILPIADFNEFKGANGYGGEAFKGIMQNYLKGEIIRLILGNQDKLSDLFKMDKASSNNLIRNFSLFKELLPDSIKQDLIIAIKALPVLEPNSDELYNQADILASDFITKPSVMPFIRNFLYSEVKSKLDSLNKYGFDFNDRFWLDKSLKDLDTGTILRSYIVNEFILHTEQTKLFNGDIVFYSTKDGEFHKRTPSSGSTGLIPITDNWFVDSMNSSQYTNLQAKNLGLNNQYSNVLKTVVFREHVPISVYIDNWSKELKARGLSKDEINRIVEPYRKNKEGDAQGWITMDYYRSFKISIGDWRPNQEKVYEKISKGEVLSVEEVETLGRLFPPVKAQYSGPIMYENYHVPGFHKFSLMPLLPSAIKGTALESLNERMIRNNVSYALMESGSKLGTTGSELESFYKDRNSRTMKDPTTPFESTNNIFTHYLKEQVQIEPELHNEVIFGTQFRKLLFQNVYSNGKPTNKKLAALEKEYSGLIDEITKYEVQRLINDMGVSPILKDDQVTDYEVKDQSKFLNRIKEEIDRRRLNNSIKNFFELEDGKLKYPLDASINHQQVRTLILSMINNRLIRQTIKGDMLIQGSSLGYEKLTKPTDAQLLEYGTNGLRFYHVEGSKVRKMQVKTSLTGDFKHLLNYNWKGEKIATLEKLNQALKDDNWVNENEKSINMIGYRIPTQGLNSIESMVVAEFLPPEAGPILIVPTEIVSKAGSDFDIDKLNVFKPSLVTKDGKGSYIERTQFKGTKTQIKESINAEIEDLKNKRRTYKFFSSLDDDAKQAFISNLTNNLDINDNESIERLGNIGRAIQERKDQIKDSQNIIDNLNAELRAGFNPDKYEELIGERANQMELRLFLSDDLDNIDKIKNELLSSKSDKDLTLANDLLNTLYDKLFNKDRNYNDEISNQIRALVQERTNALDQVSNYKFGLFNRLIEVASERLTDPDSFSELITPNNTDLLKPKVQEIAKKSGIDKKSYLHTNNLTSSTQEEKFLAGIPNKKALGVAAVANTMSQLFNKIGLRLNQFFKKREVFHPMVDDLNMSDKYLKDNNLKSEVESQMINAYVDVLNDDFISKANLSLDTAGAFFYLLHMGTSKDQLMDFFNNPVIKTYVTELQKGKSIIRKQNEILKGRNENLRKAQAGDDIIEDLDSYVSNKEKRQAYLNATGLNTATGLQDLREEGRQLAKAQRSIFSSEHLSEAVGKKLSDIPTSKRQAILSYYLDVLQESSELLKLQQSNNYDTTTSVNPISNEFREELKKELEDGGLFNTTDVTSNTVIKPFNQFALTSALLNTLMPATLNKEIRQQIVDIIKDLKAFDIDKLTRTFINDWVYYLAVNFGKTASDENFGQYGKNLLLKTDQDNRLVNTLLDFKLADKWKNLRSDFPVIDSLRADIDGNIGNISLYREDNSTEYQNSIIEQLQGLAGFNDPTYSEEDRNSISKFAKDLILLGFTQSGLNKSPISFSDLIPNEYYAPMMTKALESYKSLSEVDQKKAFYDFASKFRSNNPAIFGERNKGIPYWRFKDYTSNVTSKVVGKTLSMQPDNIQKIKDGTKTITNRTQKLDNGIYTLPDGTKVGLKWLGVAKVYDEGVRVGGIGEGTTLWGFDDFAQAEGFKDWADFEKNNKFSKNFINGSENRYIYQIGLGNTTLDSSIDIQDGTYDNLLSNLLDDGLIKRICI